jgi:hypothetical protein
MRQFNRGLLMLALGLPLSTFAATGFSGSGQPVPKADCSGVTPSYGLVRQTIPLGPLVDGYVYAHAFEDAPSLTEWADLFGSPFPSREGGDARLSIESGKFVALAFETGARGDPVYGGSDSGIIRAFATVLHADLTIAISECPGDFLNPAQGSSMCRVSMGQGAFSWQLAGAEPFTCQLAENTTYYLNLAHVDSITGQNMCPGNFCNSLMEAR